MHLYNCKQDQYTCINVQEEKFNRIINLSDQNLWKKNV